ncbi:hypothetical protein IEO21_04624 [Rhodonia placenta]|uniref:SGNH hydrolase-type esterase domain-containing protein n=1 Tax=Rhodonia placenta TaxID=104341 RepID=A0A8H7P3I2_9APHY|nr:hypothetical protein IEO21_04624 [Postia placenta]
MAANIGDMIMLFGDSLTQRGWESNGFAERLAYVYNRKLDVINRGMSGYNTEWIVPVFEQCFATQHEQQHVPKVRILTIWLGANDAAPPGALHHVPRDAYAANLVKLIRMVRDPASPRYSPETHVLLLTPPPVNTHQWRVGGALDRNFEATRSYAQAARDVGAAEDVPVVDIWNKFWDACGHVEERLSEYLQDGLHLNQQGYAIVFDEIIKTISATCPELHYDSLTPVFPPWDRIDLDNIPAALDKRSIFSNQ